MNNIILFPSRLGQKIKGVDRTPLIFKDLIKGNINIVNCSENLDDNLNNLYLENLKVGSPKINIGGDHSMSISTVATSLSLNRNLKVLWIDAHPDINTRLSSFTSNYHGMPLGFLTKLDNRKFKFQIPRLQFKNILYVGIREIDSYEKQVIEKYNINYIKCSEVNKNPEECLKRIKNFINRDPLHISFDVDSIDPELMPCTGTKVKEGLLIEPIRKIMDGLVNEKIVNMDIAELNLHLGTKEEEEKSIYNFINIFEKYLRWK
jgi:arginase